MKTTATWTRFLPESMKNKLHRHNRLQSSIDNIGWLLADNIVRMAIGLIVSIIVTRYLGPERFGSLNYAITFVMLLSPLSLLGLDFIVVRNLARNPESRDETLGSAFVLKLSASFVMFCLINLAIHLLHPADESKHILVAIISIGTLFQAFGTIEFWFQSQVNSKYTVYTRFWAFISVAAAKILLVLLGSQLPAFAWTRVADVALSAVALVAAYRLAGVDIKSWRATKDMAKGLLKDSWPLMLTDIVVMLNLRIDKVMLGDISGNSELGIYAAATLITESIYFIPTAVSSSIFPTLANVAEIGEEMFLSRFQKFYKLMALLGYGVAIPVSLLASWGIPLMFGADFRNAAPLLVGLVWAGLFINLSMARNYFLTAMNWTRLHFLTDLIGCLTNISLNIYLIPRYGAMGAVVASIISYWFTVHGTCLIFKQLRRTGIMITKAMLYPKPW